MHDKAPSSEVRAEHAQIIQNLYQKDAPGYMPEPAVSKTVHYDPHNGRDDIQDTEEFVEESLSLEEKEIELIKKALEKHKGKRKYAAQELGISERTLYRKIKEYDIE
jgi:transcriptional regulator with PAS, ATPase and Fis domain